MDVKINEERFKKLLFKHLDSNEYLSNSIEHGGNIDGVKDFFFHYKPDNDDILEDYDFVFCYFKTSEDYEHWHKVITPYESSMYPLIELDGYYYQEIIDLFGDTYSHQFILEWLNNRYGLDANSIVEY